MSILQTRDSLKRAVAACQPYVARKGDVVAIERRHSSTYVHGQTVRHSTWHVGRVESASRDGLVKSASADLPTESGRPFPMKFGEWERQHNVWAAYTITDVRLREAAARLVPCEFQSGEELKAAIRAAAVECGQ
jgi:hypothetical protein